MSRNPTTLLSKIPTRINVRTGFYAELSSVVAVLIIMKQNYVMTNKLSYIKSSMKTKRNSVSVKKEDTRYFTLCLR